MCHSKYMLNSNTIIFAFFARNDEGMSLEQRHNRITKIDAMDAKFGFERYKDPTERLGWLINMHPVSIFVLHLIHLPIC